MGLPPQNDFSLLDRRFEGHLAEACAPFNYNVGLLSYGPLAGGEGSRWACGACSGRPCKQADRGPCFKLGFSPETPTQT